MHKKSQLVILSFYSKKLQKISKLCIKKLFFKSCIFRNTIFNQYSPVHTVSELWGDSLSGTDTGRMNRQTKGDLFSIILIYCIKKKKNGNTQWEYTLKSVELCLFFFSITETKMPGSYRIYMPEQIAILYWITKKPSINQDKIIWIIKYWVY